MKKTYKLLLILLIAEIIIASVLADRGITVESGIENTLGVLIFLSPALILLFMLGRDEDFTEKREFALNAFFGILQYAIWQAALRS